VFEGTHYKTLCQACWDVWLHSGNEGQTETVYERYEFLRRVFDDAYNQASAGKGSDRHDIAQEPYQDQQIVKIGLWQQSIDFCVGQACKKSLEAKHLSKEAARNELLGAINYLAAAVITLDRLDCNGNETKKA